MANGSEGDACSREPRDQAEAGPADDEGANDRSTGSGISPEDEQDVHDGSRLSALKIYEILRREGAEEMGRPATSLCWSGVAAGLSISFSVIVEGALWTMLPDAPWRPLITGLGYTVGFLIAVMARHQLFTENTITVVLPVAARPTSKTLARMGRLWAIVLASNLAGTLLAALFCTHTSVVPPAVREAMLVVSHESISHPPLDIFFKAIAAGFLIAAMVWLLPSANATQFHVIILLTYVIAICGFAHVIAGSFEGFLLVLNGRLQMLPMLAGFALPALVGNIIGGTALFAVISYGQVAKEM
jgi:formate/nitrite transporter FocA (FNT family)